MKLYYFSGACSLAPHIVLRELGLPFSLVKYDQQSHQIEGGAPIESVNEKGTVPVLELDNGERLTEVAVITQYLADLAPEKRLAPPFGSFERYRLMEWLNFIATEVHKNYYWLFHQGGDDHEKNHAKEKLDKSYAYLQGELEGKPYLMGDFTVADAYLVVVLNWMKPAGLDIEKFPGLKTYRDRVRVRPAVQAAMEAEGLIRKKTA